MIENNNQEQRDENPKNSMFNLNEFSQFKSKLNWLPSMDEYKFVLEELGKYSTNQVCESSTSLKDNNQDESSFECTKIQMVKKSNLEQSSSLTSQDIVTLNKYLNEINKQTFV